MSFPEYQHRRQSQNLNLELSAGQGLQLQPPYHYGSPPRLPIEQINIAGNGVSGAGGPSNYQFSNPWQQRSSNIPQFVPQQPPPQTGLGPHQFIAQVAPTQNPQQMFHQAPQQINGNGNIPIQTARRQSSIDSIWNPNPASQPGSTPGNIWSSSSSNQQYRAGSTGTSLGDVLSRNPNPNQNPNQNHQNPHSNQHHISPNVIDNFRSSYDPIALDFRLRRHSYGGDVHQFQMNPPNSFNISPPQNHVIPDQGLFQLSPPSQYAVPNAVLSENNLLLSHDYFVSDPHERVRVTMKLLEEKFVEEEKYLGDTYQLPNFPVENSLRNFQLVLVGFKAGRIDVFHLPNNPQNYWVKELKIGDLVTVEADRGKDLGKIFKLNVSIDEARLLKLLQFQEQQAALSDSESNIESILSLRNFCQHPNPPALHYPKPILGIATIDEISQILSKKQDEDKACRLCLQKISNTTTIGQIDLLQMKLIDAEYQFDRKKLIFYYSTSKRIDFRDLVRELFRIYKTRIWMCAVIGLPYTPQGVNLDASEQSQLQPQSRSQSQSGPSNNNGFLQSSPPGQGQAPGIGNGNFHANANGIGSRSGAVTGLTWYSQILNGNEGETQTQSLLRDPFKYQGQYFQPSLSEEHSNKQINLSREVPRKFGSFDQNSSEEENGQANGNGDGESSFVLQSLVDSIDH